MCVQVTQKHNWFGLSRGGCNDNPPCGYGLHISYLMYRVGPWNWALEVSPSLFWTVESYPCSSSGTSCPFENFFSNRWKRTCWCTPFLQESMNRELHGFMQTHYLWSLSPSKRLGELLCCVCMQYAWQVVKSTSSARPNAYQRVMQRAGHLSLAQMNHHCTDLHLDEQGFTL